MRRLYKAILVGLVLICIVAIPVLAAYRATYTITDGAGFDMLATTADVNNEWMADNGFFTQSAMDTRIETLGGLQRPWMVAQDRTLTASPVPASSQVNLYFTTDNSLASSMDVICANSGYVTMTDDGTLEPGTDFAFDFDGYVDTSASMVGETLIDKPDAFSLYVSDTSTLTAELPGADIEYTANDDGDYNSNSNIRWFAEQFITVGAVTISSVEMKLFKAGNPGWLFIDLTEVDGADEPTGGALSTGTYNGDLLGGAPGAWVEFPMTSYTMAPAHKYAITLRGPSVAGGDVMHARVDTGGSVYGGRCWITNNGGGVWNELVGEDWMFEIHTVSALNATISSGEYQVEVYTTGANWFLDIEGSTEDSSAVGAGVPGNANDWTLMSDAAPYWNYYSHTVGGVEHALFDPNDMVENTGVEGTETAGGSMVLLTAAEITEGVDYWVGGRVIITEAGGVAPEGEVSIVTASAIGSVTIAPALTVNIDIGDEFTVDFGTAVDRSHYGHEFDALGDEIIVTDAVGVQNVFDSGGSIALWTNVTSDGENNQGRIADKTAWYVRVDNEAAGMVRITFWYDFDGVADGTWVTDAGELTIGTFDNLVITYDADAVANNPIFYVNDTALTVGSGLTESTTPVGTRVTDVGSDLYIGDDAGGTHCFDGVMDEFWLFSAELTPADVTADYNGGGGSYIANDVPNWDLQLHVEDGSGATSTDASAWGNDGAITNALWVNGYVERTPGNGGTNDARITWGIAPAGVTVAMGGMVSSGTPTPGAITERPTVDYLPATEGGEWFVDPDVVPAGLLTNPLRPFVTVMSDTTTISEMQAWRLLTGAFALLVLALVAGATNHLILAGIAVSIIFGMANQLDIYPFFPLVFVIILTAALAIKEMRPSL